MSKRELQHVVAGACSMAAQDSHQVVGTTSMHSSQDSILVGADVEAGCRVLLVGELNPYGAEPEFALYCHPPGCSGARLRLILGLSEDQYLDLHRANLCTGDWSKEQAKTKALELLALDSPWSVMVLLGRKVAEVFEKLDGESIIAFSSRMCCTGKTLVSLPHPSGRNAALWNLRARERAREILRGLAPELPWGSATAMEGVSS